MLLQVPPVLFAKKLSCSTHTSLKVSFIAHYSIAQIYAERDTVREVASACPFVCVSHAAIALALLNRSLSNQPVVYGFNTHASQTVSWAETGILQPLRIKSPTGSRFQQFRC